MIIFFFGLKKEEQKSFFSIEENCLQIGADV